MNRRWISSFILVLACAPANLNRRYGLQGRSTISRARFGLALSCPAQPCTNVAILLDVDCLLGCGAHQGSRTLGAAQGIRCAQRTSWWPFAAEWPYARKDHRSDLSQGSHYASQDRLGGRSCTVGRSGRPCPSAPRDPLTCYWSNSYDPRNCFGKMSDTLSAWTATVSLVGFPRNSERERFADEQPTVRLATRAREGLRLGVWPTLSRDSQYTGCVAPITERIANSAV